MVRSLAFLRSSAAQRIFQRTFLHFSTSSSQSISSTSTIKSKGPRFARYFWYTTAIMLGIPGAIGGMFVYNLKTDDEFYRYFNGRYPKLIEAIEIYVPLNEKLLELVSRDDIGPIGSTEDLMSETMNVIVELQSHQKVRLELPGSTSQEEIKALALKQSSHPESDRVIAITVSDHNESEKDGKLSVPTALEAWPPAPRVTWGSAAAQLERSKKPVSVEKALQLEIDEIRAQQSALEASKYAGRDIDEVDEEIAALEERKIKLKEQIPRKRFLWIF